LDGNLNNELIKLGSNAIGTGEEEEEEEEEEESKKRERKSEGK